MIQMQETKKDAICFDALKTRFSDFLLLQSEYDLYSSPQNEIAKSIHTQGKTCSVHELIASQPIIDKLFYNKYVKSMQNCLIQHKWLNKSQQITHPHCKFSVYKFGNRKS